MLNDTVDGLTNMWFAGENDLSFIETSALDTSNVELAFQTIIAGQCATCVPSRDTDAVGRHLPDRVEQDAD